MDESDTGRPKHSPAPWRIEDVAEDGDPVLMLIAADGKRIAEICWMDESPEDETDEESEQRQDRDDANDNLLTSAPKLLALAYDYESTCIDRLGLLRDDEIDWRDPDEWSDMIGHWTVQLEKAREVIAKTEGR